MSAQPAESHGLSEAQQRLDDLLVRLNNTVELAGELANAGEDETALRLLAEQRAHLYAVVDSISKDIGTGPRPFWTSARRHAGVLAVAAVTVLSCAAASLVAWKTTPVDRARNDLARATEIADPAARLSALLTVHDRTRRLAGTEARVVRERARALVEQTEPDVPATPENDEIKRRADKLSHDVDQAGRVQPPRDPDDMDRFRTDVEDVLE